MRLRSSLSIISLIIFSSFLQISHQTGCCSLAFHYLCQKIKTSIQMKKTLFLSLLLVALISSCTGNPSAAPSDGPSFHEVITTRRSIRQYDATKTISEAEVRQLLTLAQEAPSWANTQASKYYVAITPEKVAAVQGMIGDFNKRNVQGAPVLIVSTFERGKSGHFNGKSTNEIGDGWGAYDNGLSNAFFVLSARSMGFDTLIMGMRDSDALRALFGIPDNETVMSVIALGYRASEPKRPRRRPLDEIVSFH